MLSTLHIIDLAVVKNLEIELKPGMSVLTGETGAGKSILLTALGLGLGNRADSGFIRPGCQRAEITLEFDLSDALPAQQWLKENELDDDRQCIIRRTVNQDGRSKAWINNRPVTIQSLVSLGKLLVEIHGQHAHLTLLNGEEQRRLLDSFAGNSPLLSQLNAIYQQWKIIDAELTDLRQNSQDQNGREELLRYQLDELQQLNLEQFDFKALSDEHSKLSNLGQILSQGQQQLTLLYDSDDQSINQLLGQIFNQLTELTRFAPELNEIATMLEEAQIQISEASHQLRHFLEAQELDPERLSWLDNQISLIMDLSRKHQCDPDDLPEKARQIAEELDNLTHSDERIEQLTVQSEQLLQQYHKLAQQLSKRRQQQGKILAGKISAMIQELGMPQGEFIVKITPTNTETAKLNGTDIIEFLISANPGLPPKPLAKVASGGELSRISLAIQVTTSSDKTIPTMIFDEVDAGIGGGIAEIVGRKMRQLATDRQVLCVTHLPQVAAQAHQHLYVSKNTAKAITSSSVRQLNAKERLTEIARMLGGVNITENTLKHAEEMLQTGD
jgi:DNA repair protein RecN (Recombination protein N)